jgi:uncharacterized protein
MREVFADTFWWIALANRKDNWHQQAKNLTPSLSDARIVTSDEVLIEFLNFFSNLGTQLREKSSALVEAINSDANSIVIPATRDTFKKGRELYRDRTDKEWSVTDCMSMNHMSERKIREVLTHDHHFTQAGFTILLP